MQREAEASCALDGDTQSFPVKWVKYVRMPNGKIVQVPYFPGPSDLLSVHLVDPDDPDTAFLSFGDRDSRRNGDANADLRDVPR